MTIMALPVSFDELNRLVGFERSLPIDQYFDEMRLTTQQKEQRKRLARQLEDEMVWLMSYMFYARKQGISVSMDAINEIRERYREAVGSTVVIDLYIASHIDSVTANIVDATNRHKDDPYYYSEDRARLIAENDSSYIYDHDDYEQALQGKTHKQWLTVIDGHERDSHAEVNGQILPIGEPFVLQGGEMMHAHDDSLGASDEELVNCRCVTRYF